MSNLAVSKSKNEHTFKKIPDFLFTNPNYSHISNDAKLLYSLLLSRHSLSEKNKAAYSDERGIYIIFTRENMAIALNCSTKKVKRLVQELCITGLVQDKQMGLNKPNRIYVKQMGTAKPTDKNKLIGNASPTHHGHDTLSTQEPTKLEVQEPTNIPLNKIDINYIDYECSANPNGTLSILSTESKNTLGKDKNDRQHFDSSEADTIKHKKNDEQLYLETVEQVKEQIEFDEYYACEDEDIVKRVQGLMATMVEVYTSKKVTARVNGQEMGIGLVRRQFKKIDHACIDYALESLDKITSDIKDIRAYIRTTLYNAPDTVELFFRTSMGF